MRRSGALDRRPEVGGQRAVLILLASVLALQLWLLYGSLTGGTTPVFPSLAATYVVAAMLVGSATDRLRSPGFLAVLFAGWTALMLGVYLETPTAGYAAIAGLTAVAAAYYAYRYRSDDDGWLPPVTGN